MRVARFSISNRRRGGFTLVELVMVVTIIGVVAAIAVPRMSNASARATTNSVEATLAGVRTAIDLYYAEHNRFPGYHPTTLAASGTHFVDQLTKYTDKQGNFNATKSVVYKYGPYLRSPFPTNPTNKLKTVHVKATPAAASPADGTVGWVAVLSTGDFGVSATDAALDEIGATEPAVKGRLRLELN